MSIVSILIAILVFAVLVIVHEFGHFIVAKRSGVRVDEFAVGFPPRLWSIKRGETRYSINALPLGGYVLMPGENGDNIYDDQGNVDQRTFAAKSAGKRAAILVAGVTMNLILAWVLYMVIFAASGVTKDVGQIGVVQANSPAQTAGLVTGDRIIAVDGKTVSNSLEIQSAVNAVITNDTAAADKVTVPVTLIIRHANGTLQTETIRARRNPPAGQGHIGFIFGYETDHLALWQLPGASLHQIFIGNFQAVGDGFHQVLTGVIKPQDAFSGPIGIVKATSEAANQGVPAVLNIMAFLSWNLAVFNLLPIPGLDGGRLFFIFIEVLRRGRKLAPEREALINLAGLGFLLSLVLIFTVNDVLQIIHGQ